MVNEQPQAAIIFCQELPKKFKDVVSELCNYEYVAAVDKQRDSEAAVMWAQKHFNTTACTFIAVLAAVDFISFFLEPYGFSKTIYTLNWIAILFTITVGNCSKTETRCTTISMGIKL